ncbi:MAG TPA: pyridoxal-phosphate dependent enzyme, partial [Anaeromyxobacteraceae bacterium]|nr:pyridoxal-phosphate dependent enzyme [Anaeromyxobacteraceae bacterium]
PRCWSGGGEAVRGAGTAARRTLLALAAALTAASAPARADGTALERAFPSLRLPRVPLVRTPTPLEPLAALEQAVRGAPPAGAPWLWIKRDDVADGLVGGNKARKLEYLLGEARASGATSIVTSGRYGTHLGVAASEAARRLGLRAVVVLAPQPASAEVRRNLLALHATGAELRPHGSLAAAVADVAWLRLSGAIGPGRASYIPPSGTSPLGSVGYASAFLELLEQAPPGREPDEIVVPASTGGTAAGLLAGICLSGRWGRTVVRAVGVTDPWLQSEWLLRREARDAHELLRGAMDERDRARAPSCDFSEKPGSLVYVTGYLGAGYGRADPETDRVLRLVRERQGVELDAVYAGKAMRHFLDRAAERLRAGATGRPLVFWDTYAPVDLEPGIAAHPWSDPAEPWRDLPPSLHALFAPAG